MPTTLGSALEASSIGMAKARRSMDEAANSIARFGQASASQGSGEVGPAGPTGEFLQLSKASAAFKANATVARIADQAMSEIVGLGGKLDRKV